MDIEIDHRERSTALLNGLHGHGHVIRKVHLAVGDYRFDDGLLFERKTLQDLSTSLADGRLFRQASRMHHWANACPTRWFEKAVLTVMREREAQHWAGQYMMSRIIALTDIFHIFYPPLPSTANAADRSMNANAQQTTQSHRLLPPQQWPVQPPARLPRACP